MIFPGCGIRVPFQYLLWAIVRISLICYLKTLLFYGTLCIFLAFRSKQSELSLKLPNLPLSQVHFFPCKCYTKKLQGSFPPTVKCFHWHHFLTRVVYLWAVEEVRAAISSLVAWLTFPFMANPRDLLWIISIEVNWTTHWENWS